MLRYFPRQLDLAGRPKRIGHLFPTREGRPRRPNDEDAGKGRLLPATALSKDPDCRLPDTLLVRRNPYIGPLLVVLLPPSPPFPPPVM